MWISGVCVAPREYVNLKCCMTISFTVPARLTYALAGFFVSVICGFFVSISCEVVIFELSWPETCQTACGGMQPALFGLCGASSLRLCQH